MNQKEKLDLRPLYKPGDRVFYAAHSIRSSVCTYRTGTVSRVSQRILFVKPDFPEDERYLSGDSGLMRYAYMGVMRDIIAHTPENAKIVEELSSINEMILSGFERAKELNNELKETEGGNNDVG